MSVPCRFRNEVLVHVRCYFGQQSGPTRDGSPVHERKTGVLGSPGRVLEVLGREGRGRVPVRAVEKRVRIQVSPAVGKAHSLGVGHWEPAPG